MEEFDEKFAYKDALTSGEKIKDFIREEIVQARKEGDKEWLAFIKDHEVGIRKYARKHQLEADIKIVEGMHFISGEDGEDTKKEVLNALRSQRSEEDKEK